MRMKPEREWLVTRARDTQKRRAGMAKDGEKRYPIYRLKRELMNNPKATHTVGGYHPNDPPRKVLTMKNPYIFNTDPRAESYEIYVPTTLQRVERQAVPITEVKSDLASLATKLGKNGGKLKKKLPPTSDPEDVGHDARSKPDAPSDVDVVEPEGDDVVKVEDALPIPDEETLNAMNRKDLADLADKLGEWDNIEATGSDGYRKHPDIVQHLLKVRERR
jgi:hypothetical protein